MRVIAYAFPYSDGKPFDILGDLLVVEFFHFLLRWIGEALREFGPALLTVFFELCENYGVRLLDAPQNGLKSQILGQLVKASTGEWYHDDWD